jgi:hypothetical protein
MPIPTRPRRLASGHFRALAAAGLRTPIGTDLVLHVPEAGDTIRRKVEVMLTEAA